MFRMRRIFICLAFVGVTLALSGCQQRLFTMGINTGSHMNTEEGGEPTPVRLQVYHLVNLPPGLPSASCAELRGSQPEVLSGALIASYEEGGSAIFDKSISPHDPKRAFGVSMTVPKGAKWTLVVPNYFDCRDDTDRWVAFKLEGSGETVVRFQLQGYSIRPHPSMHGSACTNTAVEHCKKIAGR